MAKNLNLSFKRTDNSACTWKLITRILPESFLQCLREDKESKIDFAGARLEHEALIHALASNPCTSEVVQLVAEEAFPDSVYISVLLYLNLLVVVKTQSLYFL